MTRHTGEMKPPMNTDQHKQSAVSFQLSAKSAPRLKLIAGSCSLTAPGIRVYLRLSAFICGCLK
jgi:hypothetical protein